MKFGEISIKDAQGAILAHAIKLGNQRLKKGTQLEAAHIDLMGEHKIASVIAARLDDGDFDENSAAQYLTQALKTQNIEAKPAHTGRVNLHATKAGLFEVNALMINAFNGVDPAVTLATLPDFARVTKGQMVATVKIIPFAVHIDVLKCAVSVLQEQLLMQVHGFSAQSFGLIQTSLPMTKQSVLDKTVQTLSDRLARSKSKIILENRIDHNRVALARAMSAMHAKCDCVIIFGASAMCDANDIIPAAIKQLGGDVERVGMPVDPGNLLVLGSIGEKTIIGAPGCARSSKENGFDWVLDRILAQIKVSSDMIAQMGVGGLLNEINTRPQPRENL